MNKKTKSVLWIAGALFLLIYPKLFGIYYANIVVTFAVYALYASSLNLLLGYTGLLSFGHAMYFGTGAYGTALALTHIPGLPLIPAVLVGFLASVVLALCIAPLVVRVGGNAFAMMHMAFGQLMFVLALKLRDVTGGEDGIQAVPRGFLFGVIDLWQDINLYYVVLTIFFIGMLVIYRIIHSPFGQVLKAIRENEARAISLGYNVNRYKLMVFVMSATLAGLAGPPRPSCSSLPR